MLLSTARLGAVSCVDKLGRPIAVRVNLARCHRQTGPAVVLSAAELAAVESEARATCYAQNRPWLMAQVLA